MKSRALIFWLAVLFLFAGGLTVWVATESFSFSRAGAGGAGEGGIVVDDGAPLTEFKLTERSGNKFHSSSLDGQVWNGYRLEARRLPVIWGEVLLVLREQLRRLRPVAVFAFGQGDPDRFDLETQARNRRAPYPDNRDQLPEVAQIVPQGAQQYAVSANIERYAEVLSGQGYEARVSTDAGSYLCEECLYSLEYLKATEYPDMGVFFCHMPPLSGAELPQPAAKHTGFVRALLSTWAAEY